MSLDVMRYEILEEDITKPEGQRRTKFNCSVCQKPLMDTDLSEIRWAHAPSMHYPCFCKSQEDRKAKEKK